MGEKFHFHKILENCHCQSHPTHEMILTPNSTYRIRFYHAVHCLYAHPFIAFLSQSS